MKKYEYNEFEVKTDYIDEIEQEEISHKRKRRKKGIKNTLLSLVFVFVVFGIVINAGLETFGISNPLSDLNLNIGVNSSETDPTAGFSADRKDDFITILVGVTDEGESRTDALVLVAYDKANQTVEMMNIPRDTYCNATTNSKKVNAAYVRGIDHTMATVADLVGFTPDKYIVMNFDGLAEIIDTIGGVEVDVQFDMKYDDPTQDLHIDIKAGLQVLDGENSVDYLRFRKNNNGSGYATGDLGRIEATQAFISTLKDQMLSMSTILKIPSISTSVFNNVTTDLTLSEIAWLGTNGLKITELNSQTLPGVAKYISGVSYYVPNGTEILELVNEKFNPYIEDITSLNLY
ncbi:MAG: LCP family protein [Clostridia bacterium]